MAYNPYDSANKILNLKGEWEAADEEGRKKVAQDAQKHYDDLIGNNYGDIANQLQGSNYSEAQSIVKGVGTQGKSPIRESVYTLGRKYDLTPAQIDKDFRWDPSTGNVFFGGINMGKGNNVDGHNYYDQSTIEDGFKQYVDATGQPLSEEYMYNQGLQNVQDKANQLWGTSMDYGTKMMDSGYGNPFETETGKGILDYYAQAGEKAGYNQIALGAGTNGGNVDSYSQANAIRQNAALRSQGEMAAINAWNAQRAGIRDDYNAFNGNMQNQLTQGMQQNQQIFDNGETRKNNQMDNWAKQSSITGYVPMELADKNNPYIVDGRVDEDMDYQLIYEQAVANGDTVTAGHAQRARQLKYQQNPEKYGGYINEKPLMLSPQASFAATSAQADRDLQRHGIDTNSSDTKYITDAESANAKEARELQKELAQMTDPVQQIQRIENSGFDRATKDAILRALLWQ